MTFDERGRVAHGRSKRVFVRHYFEMVAAMFLGMFLLGVPVGGVLGLLGVETLSAPMMTLTMALEMSLPMAAWMRYRGHAWRVNLEMVVAMLLPVAVIIPLQSAGSISGMSAMVPEHVGMLAAMVVAMLARTDEYSGACHAPPAVELAIA
jgi:flagellar biosynthetic protein FliP